MDFLEFIRTVSAHHIVGCVGDLGDGKSITGISVVSMMRTLSLATEKPYKVASNIPLAYPHKFIEYYDELDNLFNTLIFIDEIHLIADSRNSHGKSNFFTAGVTTKVRKTESHMFWTSQETSQVEMRVRNRTTLYLNPVKVNDDPLNLFFRINLISKNKRLLGDIILNLDGFKNDYSTFYIPQCLLDRSDDQEKEYYTDGDLI